MDYCGKSTTLLATFETSDNIVLTSPDLIRAVLHSDPWYNKIIEIVRKGFPKTRNLTAPEVHEYWVVRHQLSVDDGLVLSDQRIVIPTSQRPKVLGS